MGSRIFILMSIAMLSAFFIAGCLQQEKPIGGEKDEHGCLIAAGYQWCPSKQKCMRMWEEFCPEFADQFREENIKSFEDCRRAGFPILESYPRQCRTNAGKLFVEQINESAT